jgi:hypothetical protein
MQIRLTFKGQFKWFVLIMKRHIIVSDKPTSLPNFSSGRGEIANSAEVCSSAGADNSSRDTVSTGTALEFGDSGQEN